MVCPPARNLVSPCLPLSPHMCACVDGASAFPRSCLPLSPTVSPHVSLCWMVGQPSEGLVSPCLQLSWMVCPPSRGLVSPCLPFSPHMCACLGWCVGLPKVLSLLVSHCLPLSPHMCACVGWCLRLPDVLSSLALADAPAFPRSCLPLSPSLPACVPALDAVSAFPGSCLRLSPIVRCVRLPEVLSLLVTHCFPLCVVRSPSRGLVSPCLRLWPIVSHMCACVGWCAHLPEVLPPLICHFFPTCVPVLVHLPEVLLPPVSHFLPTCVPVVDGCLSLLWCIRFPEVLPPLVSQCLPISEPALEGASAIPKSCLLLSPIASPHVSLCWMLASHGLRTGVPVLDGASVFPRFVSPCLQLFRYMYAGCWMVCPPSRGLVSPSLRLCSIVSHIRACVRCCVRLPEVLSPIVSHCLPTYVCLCWMVCPLVSPCFPLFPPYCGTRELALEGVFTFPRSRLPIVSPYIYLPLSPTVSQCLPLLSLSPIALIVSPHACLWMVGSPF